MCYLIDIQLFYPLLQVFLVCVVVVLTDDCCTTPKPILYYLWGNPSGQKPIQPGPLIFEAVGRLASKAIGCGQGGRSDKHTS